MRKEKMYWIKELLIEFVGSFLIALGLYNFALHAEFPLTGFSGIALGEFNSAKLSGGTYKATNTSGNVGGIVLFNWSGTRTADKFNELLATGYKFSPALATKDDGSCIYSQAEIAVVKETEDTTDEKTTPEKETEETTDNEETYTILDGADQTFVEGQDLVIRASGSLENLASILFDGVELSKENYELKSGSTILTLKSAFLATVSKGNHTITFLYNDGKSVSTSVTVGETSLNSTAKTATTTVTNFSPKTGDNILVYGVLFVVATVGMVTTMVIIKKRKK